MSVFLLRRFPTFVATPLVASGLVPAVLDVLPGNVARVLLLREPCEPQPACAANGYQRRPLMRPLRGVNPS